MLQIDPQSEHLLYEPVSVITPRLDYEKAFEGWKRAWKTKAKKDFIADFIDFWSEEFSELIGQPRKDAESEFFDKWWNISELDVIEIDDAWWPS